MATQTISVPSGHNTIRAVVTGATYGELFAGSNQIGDRYFGLSTSAHYTLEWTGLAVGDYEVRTDGTIESLASFNTPLIVTPQGAISIDGSFRYTQTFEPIGGVFSVAGGTTDRTSIRPPVGEAWMLHLISVEGGGASNKILMTKETSPGVFLDVSIGTGSGIVLSDERIVVSNDVFLSILNGSASSAVKAAFSGVKIKGA